jgi:hypothetical protein
MFAWTRTALAALAPLALALPAMAQQGQSTPEEQQKIVTMGRAFFQVLKDPARRGAGNTVPRARARNCRRWR